MIDAGTISASLILDTAPFANGIDSALSSLASLGIFGVEQGGKIGTLGELLAACGNRVSTEFQMPFQNASNEVSASCGLITGAVSAASVAVIPAAQAIKTNILTPVRQTVASGSDIMQDFGQGLLNGLSSKQGSIVAKARSIANSVASTMRKALGIASPSRVMREVGQFTAEGMALGLEDMTAQVEQASKGLAQSAVSGASIQNINVNTAFHETERYTPRKETAVPSEDILSRKLDMLIDLLSNGRQSIQLDRRTFGTLVREYT